MTKEEIDHFMHEALKEARKADKKNEIPIGAVIVRNGEIISRAYNTREKTKNSTAHAEILAISKACRKLDNWRLLDCDIFVTIEPCLMCLGALFNARIQGLYFGAENNSNGNIKLEELGQVQNHKLKVVGGIMEAECRELMSKFFKKQQARKEKV